MANIEATVMASCLALGLAGVLALSGCSSALPVKDDEAMKDNEAVRVEELMKKDEELISAIREAVAAGSSPEEIERRVGVRAVINTIRGKDRGAIMMADFAPDSELGAPLPPLHDLSWEVVYWKRPIEWTINPRFVGVAWDDSGKAEVFFAEGLEP